MSFPQARQRETRGIGGSSVLTTIGMMRGSGSGSMRQTGMQKPWSSFMRCETEGSNSLASAVA